MNTEDRRICSICGNELSGAMKFCPVCMLREALDAEADSGELSSEEGSSRHRNSRYNALSTMN
jgi:predicted amidophosphoribosyltransferase